MKLEYDGVIGFSLWETSNLYMTLEREYKQRKKLGKKCKDDVKTNKFNHHNNHHSHCKSQTHVRAKEPNWIHLDWLSRLSKTICHLPKHIRLLCKKRSIQDKIERHPNSSTEKRNPKQISIETQWYRIKGYKKASRLLLSHGILYGDPKVNQDVRRRCGRVEGPACSIWLASIGG